MIFEDIIALAKAGYTPADVREFLKADQPKAEASSDGFTGEAPAEKTETPKGEKSGTEESQDLDESPDDPKNATEAEAEPDYKAKYEAAEKALKAAQAANTKQQQPEVKDDQKIFSEAAALFM